MCVWEWCSCILVLPLTSAGVKSEQSKTLLGCTKASVGLAFRYGLGSMLSNYASAAGSGSRARSAPPCLPNALFRSLWQVMEIIASSRVEMLALLYGQRFGAGQRETSTHLSYFLPQCKGLNSCIGSGLPSKAKMLFKVLFKHNECTKALTNFSPRNTIQKSSPTF